MHSATSPVSMWLNTCKQYHQPRSRYQGIFKENLQLHNSPSLLFPPSLPPSPIPPLPLLAGVRGYTPGKIFGITDARRWVLEHFGHKINTVMNQVFKWCLLFRDLCLILTMFSGCCVWVSHYNGAWLAVCDTVTVLLGGIVLLAFEKILVLFSGHRKTACLQLHKIFYNCTVCAQLHTKKPLLATKMHCLPLHCNALHYITSAIENLCLFVAVMHSI